jgi:cyanophycinase
MAQIESATGIFIPGGDQVDLMERINQDAEIRQAILNRYHSGVVYAGFSAGTAAASKTMLTGRGDETKIDPSSVEIAEGLGLVNQFIIDQHFIARQRQNRLMSALMKSEEKLAVGIDEATALVVEDGFKGTVLGRSYVMLFRRLDSKTEFAISLLKNGDTVELR